MNIKLILQILLITAIISTICICIAKPTMHKSVLVYDSKYAIVPESVTTIEQTEIPILEQPPQTEVVQMTANQKIDQQITEQQNRILEYIESDSKPQVSTTVQKISHIPEKIKQNTSNSTRQVQTQNTNTTVTPQPSNQTSVNTTKTSVEQKQQTAKTAPVGNSTKTVASNHTSQTQTTVYAPQPNKVMTAQEEAIAWNKWRSNLQNQIMRDSRLPNVPNGTIFRFSFSVDKYGKVTNVQTWSETSAYTPYAIQYIAPVIRSYQGRAILNFPAGSNRITTDVKGSWRISANAKYSTPQDYNDIEKINR